MRPLADVLNTTPPAQTPVPATSSSTFAPVGLAFAKKADMASRGDRRRRGGRGGGSYHPRPKPPPSEQPEIDENSPVIKLFRGFQAELDMRHDKHERLVKLSRDITIDSKRAIFLLQRVPGADGDKLLEEAETKFTQIRNNKWRSVALELLDEDPHRFIRAYSPGLQEYVEAVSFWYYLKHEALINWQTVQDGLIFPRDVPTEATAKDEKTAAESTTQSETTPPSTTDTNSEGTDESVPTPTENKHVEVEETKLSDATMTVHVPPIEYMLGIADLTGELMRMAISAVGKGQLEQPYRICDFMRVIYDAFLSYGNVSRELSRKMSTLRQSLSKVENACYMLQVRGSEIPKHMLVDAMISATSNDYDGEMEGE